ncbi:MAG TPA: methylmalonyl Co-A mutase-associated GTPase MeaB [Thermomicrobiales bacterium]|nr:methylmalonyl Co-A mutase-associated GTPase MeaB [Thermomicrobiales bacterium]
MTDRLSSLSRRVLDGDRAALARVLTRVENDDEVGRSALENLYPHSGKAHVVGLTGPPGAGKSSLANELIRHYRALGARVAVIAIDPSSPLTGGATLGDRIRMMEWHADEGVFIRSMASRRFGGGLAEQTLAVASVFDAAGFDPVIIETVGTGQDEVAVAQLALTTLLVQAPGMGDSVQTLKAGALEIGDVLVVTKADRPDSAELARDLRRMQTLTLGGGPDPSAWRPPVVTTSVIDGEGIGEVMAAIADHRSWLGTSGALRDRQRTIAMAEMMGHLRRQILERMESLDRDSTAYVDIVDAIADRRMTPRRGASSILDV